MPVSYTHLDVYKRQDTGMPATGSGGTLRHTGHSRKSAGNCNQHGAFADGKCLAGKQCGRQTSGSFWLSSACFDLDTACDSDYDLDIRLAAG